MIGVRVLPRFPARVTAGPGLFVERAAGVYNFGLDFSSLTPATSIADPSTVFIPGWSEDGDSYARYSALAFGQVMSAGFSGVSTSSVEVGTGEKTFTASTAKAWTVGQRLRVASDDSAKVMSGPVVSYDPVLGTLVIDVDYTLGSGSHADWNISIGGERGAVGAPGEGSGDVVGPEGATDNVVALFDGSTGKLLKEGSGPLGALAYHDTVDLTSLVSGDLPLANIAQIATDRLLGRDTTGTGDLEALTVSGGIEFTGSGGIQRSALTGDVTASAGSGATTIANSVVTFAKLASGAIASQGEAEAGTATNKLMTPQRVAQAIAALGSSSVGAELLDSGTLSGAATLPIVLTSYTGYRKLVIELIDFKPATDAQKLLARFSTNGGVSYISSGYYWNHHGMSSSSATLSTGVSPAETSANIEMGFNIGSAAAEVAHFTVDLPGLPNAASYGIMRYSAAGASPTPNFLEWSGGGMLLTAGDVDAIQFRFSSGNIASGSWALYGLN